MKTKAKYNIGSKVWHIPSRIAIQCTVEEVSDFEDCPCYWLDEPIGHSVPENELFDSLEDATEGLRAYMKDCESKVLTLDEYRKTATEFLSGSHGKRKAEAKAAIEADLKPKAQGTEWINVEQL